MPYLIYLRKSRADTEAEVHGEGETLARHEKALLDLAGRMRLTVGDIYREIVSGESIATRPMMQRLLSEVEEGQWEGVLVMEIERLARGNTIDQGIVLQAFQQAGTNIITPTKTYDPNNEYDEEYFEFGLFMSRREYKAINRRMQRGRVASVQEGKYLPGRCIYGYKRVKLENQKGWTIEPVPEQAEIVRLIFDLYVNGEPRPDGTHRRLGIEALASKLNEMRIPPCRSDYWMKGTLRDMLYNPVYIGLLRWKYEPYRHVIIDGKKVIQRRRYDEDCIIAEGLHQGIVEKEIFEKAQALLAEIPPAPVGYKKELVNPLAGLIYCGKCGRSMVYRKSPDGSKKKPYIVCHARACDNVGSAFHYVEERLLDALGDWLEQYRVQIKVPQKKSNAGPSVKLLERSFGKIGTEIATLEKQMSSLHDLLEQGVYSTQTFLSRSRELSERLDAARNDYARMEKEIKRESQRTETYADFIPKVEHLLSVYAELPSPGAKNAMLKEVLEKAVYTKHIAGSKGVKPDHFELVIFPRLPT